MPAELQLDPGQEFHENGSAKNRWTPESEIFYQALMRTVFPSLSCVKIIKTLMRLEWGEDSKYGKFRLKNGVVISQAALAAAANVSEGMVIEAMKQVCPPGIVRVQKHGNQNAYSIDLRAMALAPAYEPPAQPKLELVAPKAAPAALAPHRVIAPGKIEPVTMRVPVAAGQWEERIVKVLNRDTVPIAFACTLVENQTQVEVWRHGFAANALPAKGGGPALVSSPRGEIKANSHPNALGGVSKRSTHSKQVSDFRSEVLALLDHEWKVPLEAPFLDRILKAAGPELPASEFLALAERDLALAKNRHQHGPHKGATKHGTGILIAYAKQARAAWDAKAKKRAAWEAAHPGECPACEGTGGKFDAEKNREVYCSACEGTGKRSAKTSGAGGN